MLGYQDEVWFSRLAQPHLHMWTQEDALRLHEKQADKDDPDPKALACYGLLRADNAQMLLRFVDGRPVSCVTTQFLAWVLAKMAQEGKSVLMMIWDNAKWHTSGEVREWVQAHNRLPLAVLPAPKQESVAQQHRAEMGTWQAQNR